MDAVSPGSIWIRVIPTDRLHDTAMGFPVSKVIIPQILFGGAIGEYTWRDAAKSREYRMLLKTSNGILKFLRFYWITGNGI